MKTAVMTDEARELYSRAITASLTAQLIKRGLRTRAISNIAPVNPDFAFTLLIRDETRSRGLANLKSVTLLTWENLGEVLRHARNCARRTDECGYAERAFEWLAAKGLMRVPG